MGTGQRIFGGAMLGAIFAIFVELLVRAMGVTLTAPEGATMALVGVACGAAGAAFGKRGQPPWRW